MKELTRFLFASLFAVSALAAVAGCEQENAVEEAAEEVADEADDAM